MMTNSKKVFVLVILCLLTFFSQNQVSASLPHYVSIDFGHYAASYDTRDIPAPPADGTHVFATHKKSGNQLILTARGGNIIEIAAKNVKTGRIIVLEGSATTCDSGTLCHKFEVKTCFTSPSGDCFCICGPLNSNSTPITAMATGESSEGDIAADTDVAPSTEPPTPSFDDSYVLDNLKEGTNVIDTDPATGANLILIVRKGQLSSLSVQYADGSAENFRGGGNDHCYVSGPCHKLQARHCYKTSSGACICICGRLSTSRK